MKCRFSCHAGPVFVAIALLLAFYAPADEVQLLVDRTLQRGVTVKKPDVVPQETAGELHYDGASTPPVWSIAQWGTAFNIADAPGQALASGAMMWDDSAKLLTMGPVDAPEANMIMGMDTWLEYGGEWREAGEPWPTMLVSQRLSYPSQPGPGCPWLSELDSLNFHIEARLLEAMRYDVPGFNPSLHTAHFLIHFTVQNLNQSSAGYGDYLFLGCAVYDERYEVPDLAIIHDQATGKLIYSPATSSYTSETAHDMTWITLDADILPFAMTALNEAWSRGYLADSQDPHDYRIGGMTIGWEMPGLSDVEIQFRNVSLVASGPLVGTVRDWSDPDAWPTRSVPVSADTVGLINHIKVTQSHDLGALRGPGWGDKTATLDIQPGGTLINATSALLGVGEGVTGTLLLSGGAYVGGGDIHCGRPFATIPTGHGIVHIQAGSTLNIAGQRLWIGTIGGTGELIVEGGDSSIVMGNLQFDDDRGPGAQVFELRPTASGSAGLSKCNIAHLVGPDNAVLRVLPSYIPQAGDSWEVATWTGSIVAGATGLTVFNDVQTPDGLTVSVDYGTTVSKTLVVTVTESLVAMPDLSGLVQTDAEQALTGAGLTLGTVSDATHPLLTAGRVVDQQYVAGTPIDAGSSVAITVSTGLATPAEGAITISPPNGRPFEGDPLTLTAPDGTDFYWFRDGQLITAGSGDATGLRSQVLTIDPVKPQDSGEYTCRYQSPDDGQWRESLPAAIEVYSLDDVPVVSGPLAMVLLIAACLAAAVRVILFGRKTEPLTIDEKKGK